MVALRSREVPRCCGCLTVRSVSLGLALYVLLLAAVSLVWGTVELTRDPSEAVPLSRVLLLYLLCLLLLLVSVSQLWGVLRGRPRLLLPFIVYQVLDLALNFVSLCGLFVRFPGFLNPQRARPDPFLETEEGQGMRPVLYVALAGAAVLLLKLYLLQCVWRCYLYLKAGPPHEVLISAVTLPEKGLLLLPSYEEALALPAKQSPPPPYTAQ